MEDRYKLGYTYGALDVYRSVLLMLDADMDKKEIVAGLERLLRNQGIVPTQ